MANVSPLTGSVSTTSPLNIRGGRPSVSAPIVMKVQAGSVLAVYGTTLGDTIRGNAQWHVGPNDSYFWSGGCGPVQRSGAADGFGHRGHPRQHQRFQQFTSERHAGAVRGTVLPPRHGQGQGEGKGRIL